MMNGSPVVSDAFQFLYYFVFMNLVQAGLEFDFFLRFCGKKRECSPCLLYIGLTLLLGVLEQAAQPAPFSPLFLVVRIALLFGMGAAAVKSAWTMSLPAAAVTIIASFLASGTGTSVTFLVAPAWLRIHLPLPLLGVVQSCLTFALMAAAYRVILKKFSWRGGLPSRYSAVFFLPVLLIVMVEQYICNQIYGAELVIEGASITKPVADHGQLLLIQLSAYLGLFGILYACQRLSEDFADRMRLRLLEQEIASQRDYLEESRLRYEQTQSFRHDVRQHLLALNGLLRQGELQQARDYLGKLERISEQLSYPCKTGNTVVDTLLGSKLGIARQNGIRVECTVRLPSPCLLDDLDLCVLFSNAVDNAIHACLQQEEKDRFLRISGKRKGDFFMLEVENSCPPAGPVQKGIGLDNMEAVAEKYHGALTAEPQGDRFLLNVLLVIPRRLDHISGNPH